jgi:hypothetical protein
VNHLATNKSEKASLNKKISTFLFLLPPPKTRKLILPLVYQQTFLELFYTFLESRENQPIVLVHYAYPTWFANARRTLPPGGSVEKLWSVKSTEKVNYSSQIIQSL